MIWKTYCIGNLVGGEEEENAFVRFSFSLCVFFFSSLVV